MYILAKKVETGGVTLHGLTNNEAELAAWQAAGQTAFEIDPETTAEFEPYEPRV